MNIYVGNTKKKAEKISLCDLLNHVLSLNGFKMDNFHEDESGCSIVGVRLQDDKQEIGVNICFDTPDDNNNINRINVWQAPVVTVVDYEKQKKLI